MLVGRSSQRRRGQGLPGSVKGACSLSYLWRPAAGEMDGDCRLCSFDTVVIGAALRPLVKRSAGRPGGAQEPSGSRSAKESGVAFGASATGDRVVTAQ